MAALKTLKTKAERFEQLFNNSGVGIFIVDKDRVIIEANEACCKIFGVNHSALVGQSAYILHLSYAAYVNFAEIAFNKVWQNEALNLEYPFRHNDGTTLWLRIAGDLIPSNEEVLWTITDITSRVEAQERLKEREALLRHAEEIAHFGSWEIVMDEGQSMKWSQEMHRIYGEGAQAFIPTSEQFSQYVSEADAQRVKEVDHKALISGMNEELEYTIYRKDGRKAFISTHRKAIYDDNGVALRLIGTSLDVSAQKETGRKIQELNETLHLEVQLQLEKLREKDKQLQYQSRLIQMDEMLSMIAHQWRQPLAAIAATTSLLSAKMMHQEVDRGEFQAEIERIEGYVLHLSKTIEDFRSFFKSVKQQERVSLDVVVEKTLNIVKPFLMTKNILVITEFTCKQEIETYSNELAQVILNIIKNAEDALLENTIKEPTIWIRTYDDAHMLYLEIKDNAGGIDESLFEKIFESYFTTKFDRDGTGLGLCMSKTIVEEHCQGSLRVHNDAEGAVFTIALPK